MTLHPDIYAVLGITEESNEGNIAANLYNKTHGGGLSGLNLGWTDMKASTDFLCSIVYEVDQAWTEMTATDEDGNIYGNIVHAWDSMCDNGRDHEIADSAVPIYTRAAVMAALELDAEVDDPGLLPDASELTLARFAQVALYSEASLMVYSLMQLLIDHASHA